MTDWREHNGGPQPVPNGTVIEVEGDTPEDFEHDPWSNKFRYRVPNQHLIDAKQTEIDALQHDVMWLHNALEQTEEAVVYGYTLLDDMDAKIDAARLEGIRLGLEAAKRHAEAVTALQSGRLVAIPSLDPETIAKEAHND